MVTINPCLTFNGNCEEAFTLYKSLFGGDMILSRYSEMSPKDRQLMSEEDDNKIMNIALLFYDCPALLGCDIIGESVQDYVAGNNFSITINSESKKEAHKIFNKLAAGGRVIIPMSETFRDSYFGRCTDKFGINWTMNYDMDDDLEDEI